MQRPKFQVQQKVMDFTSKIRQVVDDTTCEKHEKSHGQPCWWVRGDRGSVLLAGICNDRSRKVFVGKITEPPTRAKRPTKENR